MASTREQAVEVLNSAKLAGDGNAKVDHLRGLMELVARKEPVLLPEFLPEVLELQVDPSPAVKRFLAEFVDVAAAASPTPLVLQHSLACLRGLLADGAAATVKRTLQSCYATFRTAYTLVALRGGGGDAEAVEGLRALWTEAQALKAAVAATAAAPGNDAVRMPAAKFLEQVVLLLTAELVPAVARVSSAAAPLAPGNAVTGKAALVRDAEAALAQLVVLLKQGVGEGSMSGPLAITAIKAAAGIAQQRPQFMGRLLPPLLKLANSGMYATVEAGRRAAATTVAVPSGSGGVPNSSVANMLKSALVALVRSSHPSAQPWKKKIRAALEAMGAGDSASQTDRPDKRQQQDSSAPSKRPRLEQPQQPSPVLPLLQPTPQLPLSPFCAPAALLTPPEQLTKVLMVLQALVASQDAEMLAGVVGSLQPAVLADVVMAYMKHLPLRHTLPPDTAPLPPWIDILLQLVAAQAPLPLVQGGTTAQQQQQRPQPVQPPTMAAAANGGPAIAPQAVQQQQQMEAGTRPKAKKEAAMPVKAAPLQLVPTASFRLEPLPLTEEQQCQLRLAAVLRILHTDKTSRQQLRTVLVAKLAAEVDASMAPAIMQQLLKGIAGSSEGEHGAGSQFEVALLWLNMLFARECQLREVPEAPGFLAEARPAEQVAESGGAAADGQPDKRALAGGSSRCGRRASPPGDEAGSLYERILMQLLDGLRRVLAPGNRVIVRVLLEAPALPQAMVCQFLQQAVESGPEWCTLGLLAARDVILHRPPGRPALLQLVLDACCSPVSDTRGKAVRLVANRLFLDPGMAPQIEQAARQRVDAMLPPDPATATLGTAPSLPPATVAIAAPGSPAAPVASPCPSPAEVKAGAKEVGADANVSEQQQQQQQLQEQQEQQEAQQQQQEPIQEQQVAVGTEAPFVEPSDTEAAQLCALYCALCTKKHSLLRHLFEVYGRTSVGGQTAIQRNAGGLAKTLGTVAPALLAVVQDPPAGSLPLVLQMLHVLTETAVPSQLMVTACLQLFNGCNDARALVPALRGVDRATALRLLPALLNLHPEQLRPALQRLVAPLPAAAVFGTTGKQVAAAPLATPAIVSPEELLSALHTLDHSRDAGLLRKMMQGVTVCISSPTLFPPESLAACISQLLTRVPLPHLFMRTVIQTVAAAPRLRTFVIGVLHQLAAKQVWKDNTQWKGWLMCTQQTVPDSFPALLSLPVDVFSMSVKAMHDDTKQQMLAFAKEGSIAVPSATIAVLEEMRTPAG